METAYNTLASRVSEIQNRLSDAQKKLSELQNNTRYVAEKAQLQAGGNTTEWTSAANTFIKGHENQITIAGNLVNDLKNQLRDATTQLAAYENSSPTIKAQIQGEKLKKTLLIVGAIVLGSAILIGTIVFFVRRRKNQPTT